MSKLFSLWMIICIVLGAAVFVYVLNECGPSGLLFGNNALYAAVSGACK